MVSKPFLIDGVDDFLSLLCSKLICRLGTLGVSPPVLVGSVLIIQPFPAVIGTFRKPQLFTGRLKGCAVFYSFVNKRYCIAAV